MYNCGVYILVFRGPLGLLVLIVEEEDTPDPNKQKLQGMEGECLDENAFGDSSKGRAFSGKSNEPSLRPQTLVAQGLLQMRGMLLEMHATHALHVTRHGLIVLLAV